MACYCSAICYSPCAHTHVPAYPHTPLPAHILWPCPNTPPHAATPTRDKLGVCHLSCRIGRAQEDSTTKDCGDVFERKILTPPPPPHPPTPPAPPQKSDIQFQGIEASESKNPLGDGLIGQNNDFTRGWTSKAPSSGEAYRCQTTAGQMVTEPMQTFWSAVRTLVG